MRIKLEVPLVFPHFRRQLQMNDEKYMKGYDHFFIIVFLSILLLKFHKSFFLQLRKKIEYVNHMSARKEAL